MPGLSRQFTKSALRKRDGLVRADVLARATLGAVVRTGENSHVLKVECARGALINADAAGRAQIEIYNWLAHTPGPFLSSHGTSPCRMPHHDTPARRFGEG